MKIGHKNHKRGLGVFELFVAITEPVRRDSLREYAR